MLDGIAAAGLEWMELGPPGYLPASADVLADRGLRSVGTFVFEDLHDAGARETVAGAVHDALAALVSFGGRILVLIDRPCPARAGTAGRSRDAPRLDAVAWRDMVATIRGVAETADAAGVRAVVHHHAGGYVEFADEIERLLDRSAGRRGRPLPGHRPRPVRRDASPSAWCATTASASSTSTSRT